MNEYGKAMRVKPANRLLVAYRFLLAFLIRFNART